MHTHFRPQLTKANLRTALLLLCTVLSVPGVKATDISTTELSDGELEMVGLRVIQNWLARPFRFEFEANRNTLSYPEVCTWYGGLQVARKMGNDALVETLVKRFEPFLSEKRERIDMRRHVDFSVAGVVPLEIFLITQDDRFKNLGLLLADRQWEEPRDDGLSRECRLWIDDLFMLPALQVQAYRATGKGVYLDRAARTVVYYLDHLQQENGLFYHAPDSPFYWGRGNGWVAAGLAELLKDLPPSHAGYDRIVAGFKTMMATLCQVQAESGMWRQLLDYPDSWEESSCTGMFTFAILTGVQRGILEKEAYLPLALKAWNALLGHLDENANVTSVCVGTDKAMKKVGADLRDQEVYYFSRPTHTGDLHGQAAFLWSLAALLDSGPGNGSSNETCQVRHEAPQ